MHRKNGIESTGPLMRKQPLVSGPPPWDIMSQQALRDLAIYVDKYHKNGGGPKDTYIGELMEMARQNGFYPDRVNSDGVLIWGVAYKGELQREMERNADLYFEKGKKCKKFMDNFFVRMDE